MRRSSLLIAVAASAGCGLMIWAAWVPVIPSWQAFNFAAPVGLGIASLIAIWFAHRREVATAQRKGLRLARTAFFTLVLVTVTAGSLSLPLAAQAYGPYVERTYTFNGSGKVLYLFETSCYPPDSKSECHSYRTEIRTPLGFLPFTRTIARCNCFYAAPKVTHSTIEFAVEDTYVPETPPALIDGRTMRLIKPRVAIRDADP